MWGLEVVSEKKEAGNVYEDVIEVFNKRGIENFGALLLVETEVGFVAFGKKLQHATATNFAIATSQLLLNYFGQDFTLEALEVFEQMKNEIASSNSEVKKPANLH